MTASAQFHLMGTDPEIFLRSPSGAVLPSFQVLPVKAPGVVAYTDGFQAEISPAPAARSYELLRNISAALQGMSSSLPTGTLLTPTDTVDLSEAELVAAQHHADLGCSPSLNIYPATYKPLAIPNPLKWGTRYAGCHLHLSHTGPDPRWFPEGVVLMLDKVLGPVLTAWGRGLEDPRRRIAYGRPGEYRLPGPGRLEYRTPGAFLLSHPVVFALAADLGAWTYQHGLAHNAYTWHDLPENAHEIVQACDADAAVRYLREHQSFYTKVLSAVYPSLNPKHVLSRICEGATAAGLTSKPVLNSWKELHASDFAA